MIKKMKNGHNDVVIVNSFCIELYDIMYQDIVFGKIKIMKKFLRLFEELALPMNYVGEQKWNETLKKIVKTKLL